MYFIRQIYDFSCGGKRKEKEIKHPNLCHFVRYRFQPECIYKSSIHRPVDSKENSQVL